LGVKWITFQKEQEGNVVAYFQFTEMTGSVSCELRMKAGSNGTLRSNVVKAGYNEYHLI